MNPTTIDLREHDDRRWHAFDPHTYVHDNYAQIAPEDREILTCLAREHGLLAGQERTTIEVGAGPNMYPVMAAVLSSRQITLLEPGSQNVAYLHQQVKELSPCWQRFWALLVELDPRYGDIDIQRYLRSRVTIVEGSLFEWSSDETSGFDTVSSHFCVESITATSDGFERGLRELSRLTKPDGILLASFLQGSTGYSVGPVSFPAFPLTRLDLTNALAQAGYRLTHAREIQNSGSLVQDHEWQGMLHIRARSRD